MTPLASLRAAAGRALAMPQPIQKCAMTLALWHDLECGRLVLTNDRFEPLSVDRPGRPSRPQLTHPSLLAKRALHTLAGRTALLHAVAHIEFNAINLALDAAHRFDDLPDPFYRDWLDVAADEVRHFTLLCERLNELGSGYGDYPAHDGLWDMARRTATDSLTRMALVPRVLEARGLDVTPSMRDKFRHAGDLRSAEILDLILTEEVRHVAIGSHWFEYLCQRRSLSPEVTFQRLIGEYFRGGLRGPYNREARSRAGFSDAELDWLEAQRD